MSIGENIKKARKAAGLTQKELAKKIGVTAQMISLYETDARRPKYETLARIASAIRKNSGQWVYVYDLLEHDAELYNEIKQEHEDMVDNLPENRLMFNFNSVNKDGKKKIIEYSNDIASNPQYTDPEATGKARRYIRDLPFRTNDLDIDDQD